MDERLPILKTPEQKQVKSIDVSQISLSVIYQFIDRGNAAEAPQEVVQYLNWMEKIRCMDQRRENYGNRDLVIKHLVKVDGLSRYMADRIYDDTMEYFYSERNISRDAHRNRLAEMMMKNISLATVASNDPHTVIAINKSILDVAKVLKLDEPDPIELDTETPSPWIIYTTSAEDLGLPKIKRNVLNKQIDNIPDISEKTREHIKREAGSLPMILFPEIEKDARKD